MLRSRLGQQKGSECQVNLSFKQVSKIETMNVYRAYVLLHGEDPACRRRIICGEVLSCCFHSEHATTVSRRKSSISANSSYSQACQTYCSQASTTRSSAHERSRLEIKSQSFPRAHLGTTDPPVAPSSSSYQHRRRSRHPTSPNHTDAGRRCGFRGLNGVPIPDMLAVAGRIWLSEQ